MPSRSLVVSALLYGVLAAGVTVAVAVHFFGGTAGVVLVAAGIIGIGLLHGQAGSGASTVAATGDHEGSFQQEERDSPVSAAEFTSYLPHRNAAALTLYLVGVVLYAAGSLAVLLA